jgi:hypothetical protein
MPAAKPVMKYPAAMTRARNNKVALGSRCLKSPFYPKGKRPPPVSTRLAPRTQLGRATVRPSHYDQAHKKPPAFIQDEGRQRAASTWLNSRIRIALQDTPI